MRETIEELIDRLQGSCMESVDWDLYTTEEIQQLDEAIFECVCCGWWCEVGDHSDNEEDEDNTCGNCATQEE